MKNEKSFKKVFYQDVHAKLSKMTLPGHKIMVMFSALAIITMTVAGGQTALAQQQNQTIAELGQQTLGYTQKMGDIFEACGSKAQFDPTVVKPCLDIAKSYVEAMKNLFSTHRDSIESILYN